ncbi:hypothetical protein BU23DRAFT_442129, partial [Bimuria novae-zelandiae CBS 107.79]
CCSKLGYCGSTSAFCGTGCQKGFGDCNSSVSSTLIISIVSNSSVSSAQASSSSAVTNAKVSTDGSCGGANGFTCLGSAFGNCCSEYRWCGSADIYCGTGCNAAFGSCS